MDSFQQLLDEQDQVFRRDQALARKVSRHHLEHQLDARRWSRVLPRVYLAHTGVPTNRQRRRAALLYAGDGAALTRWTAAEDHELCGETTRAIHVATCDATRRSVAGLVQVHRLRHLRHHVTELDGFCTLTPAWTVLDLCIAGIPERELRHLLSRGGRKHPDMLDELRAALADNPFRPATAALREALSNDVVDRSRAGGEVRLAQALRRAGFVAAVNELVPLGDLDVREGDLVFHAERVVVQVESFEFHLDLAADVRRDDLWVRAGWTVVRVTNREIERDLAGALARVVAALEHRRRELDLT